MALTKNQVLALRQDLSQFLFHLTRTGTVTCRKDIFQSLPKDRKIYDTAKNRLEMILTKKVISAISPFGYFHYKVSIPNFYGGITNPGSQVQRQWLRAVCFTETPLDHIQIQMQTIVGRTLQFEPYGLAFTEGFIRGKGGTPVMYFDSNNQGITNALDAMAISPNAHEMKAAMPLFEAFGKRIYGMGPEVDFRWEREWRTLTDLNFTYADVAFGICKSEDITHFNSLVNNAFPFVDPVATPQELQKIKSYLRTFQKLANIK